MFARTKTQTIEYPNSLGYLLRITHKLGIQGSRWQQLQRARARGSPAQFGRMATNPRQPARPTARSLLLVGALLLAALAQLDVGSALTQPSEGGFRCSPS